MIVDIVYIFSNNKKIGSRFISWGTAFLVPSIKNTPSHVAVLINEKWVVESVLESGVRVISYKEWKSKNNEVAKITSKEVFTMDQIKAVFRPLKNKKYDWSGVIYFSYRVALKKFLNISIPKHNKFNHKDKYFCCEVVSKLTGQSYEMVSPVELMDKLLKINVEK